MGKYVVREGVEIMETKKCKCCGRELPLSEFNKDKGFKDGYKSKCKECTKASRKKYKKVCSNCGKEYFTINKKEYNLNFCSRECQSEYQKVRVKTKCDFCGKEIEIVPSLFDKYDKHFCNNECHTNYYKTLNTKICKGCGKPFVDSHGGSHLFCSHKCYTEWNKGENNPSYNPNLTDEEREKERNLPEIATWRKQVYERDNYTCQCCGDNKGGNLVAHHKNGYNWDKEHRTDVDNGVTLCEDCHKEFHEIYGYGDNTEEQYIEFLVNRYLGAVI